MDREKEFTILKQKYEKAKRRLDFLEMALDSIPNPIFIKNEKAEFVYFNRKYEEAFRMKRGQFLGKTALDLEYLPKDDRERYQQEDLGLIKNASILSYEVDFEFADGKIHPSLYWSSGFYDNEDGVRGLVGEIVDISKERKLKDELAKLNEKIEKIGETDALTGVSNRTVIPQKEREVKEEKGSDSKVCFMMVDIDEFKQINEELGHAMGDKVLSDVAKMIMTVCRTVDTPVRYGDDEFLVLLHDADLQMGMKIAERVRRSVEETLDLPNGKSVTVSIGVHPFNSGSSFEENIRMVDAALNEAKKNGQNRVRISAEGDPTK